VAAALALFACDPARRAPTTGVAGAAGLGGSAGGGPLAVEPPLDPGRKDMHRLNSNEYNATVRDVLGAVLQPASAAWRGGELQGFDNMAAVLGIDEAQYDRYFKAAQALSVEVMADEAQRGRFVTCSLAEPACARTSLAAAGLRVFRRPLASDELSTYERVYAAARELGDDGDAAFTLSLQALLSSAEFLYRIEIDPDPEAAAPHPLSPYELASRLSYFLWSSAPDDDLLQAAAAGDLEHPAAVAALVDKMLADPKAQRFVTNFAGQWLGARQVPAHAALPKFYLWNKRVAQAAGQEMLLYFADFLDSDRSFFEFPLADFNYVDGELSYAYGIPSTVTGFGTFERVEYAADQRRGFFGLLGFLALSSFDRRTSPSKRGHWIAGNLLCQEPPLPPADIPILDADAPSADASPLDVRARLEQHRREPGCAGCHDLFDAYGLALERYDATGVYRETYEDGTPIDPSVTLPASELHPEGATVVGLDGLAEELANDPRLGRCLAQKLLTYGLGRVLGPDDAAHLQRAELAWRAPGETPSVRRMIQALVASDAFRLRRGGKLNMRGRTLSGLSRRGLLRGAGVALALPWLESLAPRSLRAQSAPARRRFLPVYLPNGAHELWRPALAGSGSAWQLSSILEPFGASLKGKLSVLTGLENGSVFNADASPRVEPSHGRLGGAWLTCVDAAAVRQALAVDEANGISVDQILAQHESFAGQSALASLQVGLSTPLGSCDGEPCSSSRSVSWANERQPLYKIVDPLEFFSRIVSVAADPDESGTAGVEAQKRRARTSSVLDAVLENAQRTRARLGRSDQQRMDQFLDSVRAVERRVVNVSGSMAGVACARPAVDEWLHVEQSAAAPRQTTDHYDKGLHADAMSDLIAMAFECDVTRVISYMLEDERSEFVYDNVEERSFTAEGSSPNGNTCPEYHVAQHAGGDAFATITWWNVGRVADLCRKLDAIEEAPGVTVLDNTVVLFGGGMQGGSHAADMLPTALLGGGNLGLKSDQHLVLERRPLRDLYFTLLNDVFGLSVRELGQNQTGAPLARLGELLARV